MTHQAMTSTDAAGRDYEQDYFDAAVWGTVPDYSREVLTDILAVLPDDAQRILDVGCGDGFITDRLPADRDVLGCDLSPVALAHVRRPTQIADATALPYADRSYDLVMANDVIEHFDDASRMRALSEIERVADHYVIITTPFTEWLARGWSREQGRLIHVNRHHASFDVEAMKGLFSSFRLVKVLFSGVEWEDETAGVEILRRAERDAGPDPMLTRAIESARRRQGAELCAAPGRIDRLRRRTEIMGLYMRELGQWPRVFATGMAIDYDEARAKGPRRDRLSIQGARFETLALPFAPLVHETPYVVLGEGSSATPDGLEFSSNGGTVKLGFFAPLDRNAKLVIETEVAGPTRIRADHYLPGIGYKVLSREPVEKSDHFIYPLEVTVPSEYGHLFSLTIEGSALLRRAAVETSAESGYTVVPPGPRYLTRRVDEIELVVSLRDRERRVPDWFGQAEHIVGRMSDFTDDIVTIATAFGARLASDPADIVTARLQSASDHDDRSGKMLDIVSQQLPQLHTFTGATETRLLAHGDGLRRLTSTVMEAQNLIQSVSSCVDSVDARVRTLENSTYHLRKIMDKVRNFVRPVAHRLRGVNRTSPATDFSNHMPAPLVFTQDSNGRIDMSAHNLPNEVTMLVPDDRIDRRVLLEARTLVRTGAKVLVVAVPYPGENDLDQAQFPEVDIVRVDASRAAPFERDLSGTRLGKFGFDWKGVYFYTHQFLHAALSRPADLIVAHDLPVLPAAIAAADLIGARLLYDAHELYPEQEYFGPERIELYRAVEKVLAPIPDAVLTVNESIAEEMERRYDIAKPDVLLNAPDAPVASLPIARTNLLREAFMIPATAKLFLYQGSLSLNRNLEFLVEAMSLVRDPDVVLVVMGPGADKRRELEAIAETFGLINRRVFFHDAVPQTELLSYTASADIGIIPYPAIDINTTFCTPNKLFEYLVAGLPILANDLPELRRFVKDTGAGIVHPMSSAQAIAVGIDTIAAQDLAAYRTAAQATAPSMTWAAQEATFLDACRKAMRDRT